MKAASDNGASQQHLVRRWLVAEYCGHEIYMGWHLYLRDDPGYQKRNKDGDWGWVRGPVWERDRKGNRMVEFFASAFGIDLKGDWSCGRYGLDEFVKRYPLKGRKIWGKKRGGVEVLEGYCGNLTLYTPNSVLDRTTRRPQRANEMDQTTFAKCACSQGAAHPEGLVIHNAFDCREVVEEAERIKERASR